MKFEKSIFTIVICMVLLAVTCNEEDENCHKEMLIVNNSDRAIYFHPSTRYPDTLTLYPNPSLDPGYFKIAGHSSDYSGESRPVIPEQSRPVNNGR